MEKRYDSCFLHIDLDAFFASVEQLDNPEYRRKPVIVGGLPGEPRSVVSTASYEARKFGVHSAMPIAQAYRLCPNGIYVHGRMNRYLEMSAVIMDIFRDFSPDVEQMSIDEAFIDLTGTEMLFGDPRDTALKIKQMVREKTGLSVSVGLAANKYIAKIASGLNKPDGLTEIIPGTEESFMLSLPLEKIWGIGDKTRARIKNAGMKTVSDIHKKDCDYLCMIFGNATGNFLYATVRGLDNGTFSGKTKSHSISAERTFSHDITDAYTAETALLELSETVMFRLLREKVSGKTVVLKLRYDDFDTVTAQNSNARITSTDELFDRCVKLFENHWDKKRGIRLLGVAVANVDGSENIQGELFNDKSKKNQAVEKAIFNLGEKHPEIKVSRARIFGKKIKSFATLFFLFAFFAFGTNNFLTAQETISASGAGAIVTDRQSSDEPGFSETLFDAQLGKTNVVFSASGYWEAGFTQTTNMTFGYGTPFAASFGIPVFRQKVDLLLSFLLNDAFFFEAAFADEFRKNTIAMGYRGKKHIREIKIANRGIVFPKGYSIDLFNRNIGGGENQAPGISANFVGNKWKVDAAFRYDMTQQHSATFYGRSSRTQRNIALSSFVTGQQFVVPGNGAVGDIAEVFVEVTNGEYADKDGRKYKKLSRDEYLLLSNRKQILISRNSGSGRTGGVLPSVIVTFAGGGATQTIIETALGSYGDSTTRGNGFLGDLQKYFFGDSTTAGTRNLSDYSFASTATDFFTTIGGAIGLVIQSPAGFSPFAVSARYDVGTDSGVVDAGILSETTGTVSKNYEAVIVDDTTVFSSTDFFNDNHIYVDAVNSNQKLAGDASPEAMFPFADSSPGIYLGYGGENDNVLQVRTSTPVSRYDIGTDADAGSVRVYINDVIDADAKYDAASGSVTLSRNVSDTEKIYITWNEDSGTFDLGAIAAAAGFEYNFTERLSLDTSFAVMWPVTPNKKFADSNSSSVGYATLAVGTTYTNEKSTSADTDTNTSPNKFTVTDAISVTVETANATGIYRILGMDDAFPSTYYLGQQAGHNLPSGFVPSINERDGTSTTLGTDRSLPVGNGVAQSGIDGYAIPISWSDLSAANNDWAAAQISLPSASLMSQATDFSIALRTDVPLGADVAIYLQLGINANGDVAGETKDKVPTWKIYDSSSATLKDVIQGFDGTTTTWQTGKYVKVAVTDADRMHLAANHDARIIIVAKNGTVPAGTIYVGPYETAAKPVFVSADSSYEITVPQFNASGVPDASTFNTKTNCAQAVVWHNESTSTPSDNQISVVRYFKEIDFSNYETVNLAFSYVADSSVPPTTNTGDDDAIILVFDSEAENIKSDGKIALKAHIKKKELYQYIGTPSNFNRIPELTTQSWHTLSVNLNSGKISIDGNVLSTKAQVRQSVVPSRLKLQVATDFECAPRSGGASPSKFIKDGMFCFDEVNLKGAKPSVLFQNITKASYKRDGVILQSGEISVFENFFANARATESAVLKTGTGQAEANISTDTATGITFMSVALSANAALASDADGVLTGAGHDVSTVKPLFGVMSFSENYNYNRVDDSLEKKNSAALSFERFSVPFTIRGTTESSQTDSTFKQNSSADATLALGERAWHTIMKVQTKVGQRFAPHKNGLSPLTDNYFVGWKDVSALGFSSGKNFASSRNVNTEASFGVSVPVSSFSPRLTFTVDGNYAAAQSTLFTDTTTTKLEFPFIVNRHVFSVEWQKKGGGNKNVSVGGDYSRDYKMYSDSLNERSWYFLGFPIYDLFASNLRSSMSSYTSQKNTSEFLTYSSVYSASWKRPIFASYLDLIVPSSLSFSLARDIQTAENISDVYQLRINIQNIAFNLFGNDSALAFFKWYEQDEFISSFTFGFKIPRDTPSKTVVTFTGYTQVNIYLQNSGIWQSGVEANISSEGTWSARFSTAYKRSSHINPVANLFSSISKKYDKTQSSIVRKDSLDIALSKTLYEFSQSYSWIHTEEAKLFKYFSLTYGLSTIVTVHEKSASSLAFELSLGGKATF